MKKYFFMLLLFALAGAVFCSSIDFIPGQISDFIPLYGSKIIYYIRSGFICKTDVRDKMKIRAYVVLDPVEDVYAFDISNNKKFILYSVKRNSDQVLTPGKKTEGDTLVLHDFSKNKDIDILTGNNVRIHSILSSPKGNLFLAALNDQNNNIIMIIDTMANKILRFEKNRGSDMNGDYFIQDISNDGNYALISNVFWEGTIQSVFNVQTLSFEGYSMQSTLTEGKYLFGFLNKNLLLGYQGHMENQNPEIQIITHDFINNQEKVLRKTSDFPLYFDNKSNPNKVYLTLSSQNPVVKGQAFFEIDPNTLIIKKISGKKELLAYFPSYGTLWLTDTKLDPNKADLLDSEIASKTDIRIK